MNPPPLTLDAWCARWGVPPVALAELAAVVDLPAAATDGTETSAVRQIRLDASHAGVTLFRNNSGVMTPTGGGRPVRFGLGNESPTFNRVCKSSDLIGLTGQGQFVAVEVKRPGWRYRGTEREQGQLNFITQVRARGGIACFATCWGDVGL